MKDSQELPLRIHEEGRGSTSPGGTTKATRTSPKDQEHPPPKVRSMPAMAMAMASPWPWLWPWQKARLWAHPEVVAKSSS